MDRRLVKYVLPVSIFVSESYWAYLAQVKLFFIAKPYIVSSMVSGEVLAEAQGGMQENGLTNRRTDWTLSYISQLRLGGTGNNRNDHTNECIINVFN